MSRFSTDDHWQHFAEFVKWEMASGGPDPQIPMAGEIGEGRISWEEQVWRAGCYIAVYNVPFAELLWREWPWERMVRERVELLCWLEANWSCVVTRVERRCVRRPSWMTEFMSGYADFATRLQDLLIDSDPEAQYVRLWDAAIAVPRLGRYVALKILEYYRQFCGVEAFPPDIRPRGGWSPRKTLGMLLLDRQPLLSVEDNSETTLDAVNEAVVTVLTELATVSLYPSIFQIQVLLCEYRESVDGHRQYPGRSLDSELGYAHKVFDLTGGRYPTDGFWAARRKLFPERHLGERIGWDGPRKVLGTVLSEYGYTWTDLKYDYITTEGSGNFGCPVEWQT